MRIISILLLALLPVLAGCKDASKEIYHGETLKVDSRYHHKIEFAFIDVIVPIVKDGRYIRLDGAVADMDDHQEKILSELGMEGANVVYSNPAEKGREMFLSFADGQECSFIWVLERDDERKTRASLEHEKYHSLCRLNPSGIGILSAKIATLGFNLDLTDFDEELSATIVEVLSIHLQGVPIETISGCKYAVEASRILMEANRTGGCCGH